MQHHRITGALQQAGNEGRMHLFRPRFRRTRVASQHTGEAIGLLPVDSRRREDVRSHTQMLDERHLESARPGPQFADREGRDRLERRDESRQPLRIDVSRAGAEQFEGEGVDPRHAFEIVGGHSWQTPEERGRKVVNDVAGRRGHDVKIVEEPFGRRRCGLPARASSASAR